MEIVHGSSHVVTCHVPSNVVVCTYKEIKHIREKVFGPGGALGSERKQKHPQRHLGVFR